MNFWHNIQTPNFSLAPMEDVTDTSFREVVLKSAANGKLNLLFSEFTSVEGMCHPIGHEKVKHRLQINESEKKLLKEKNVKLIAQIWGKDPDKYYKTAQYIANETDFDGIDINMGCPVKNVVKNGCCSALIAQPDLAKEIILATKDATNLPLSVKTRIGFKEVVTESWISHLLQTPIDALTIHGRIQKQMSEGMADWNEIAKAVQLRNELAPHIKLIGNGDVESYQEGLDKCETYGVDGVMIGRGIFKNPWFFHPEKEEVGMEEKLEMMLEHTRLFDKTWDNSKNFAILRRFFKIYTNEFRGASSLRNDLMNTRNAEEVYEAVRQFTGNSYQ
ncbi:tRNA dihydrouridine synthase [Marinifilum flexuosum]|uniref:tRNA-dihydrouridine synthase n=1 Tax=Marinifilum flexuosum TaxID=1117708 RepID=A0A419X2M2_9BACT|nr:tRNA-dihydrouridine synthase [Marinifilum flexuosum]RKE01957.1 nifR3 family TIM-barrel protein [Marinifilum flexuosum]